MGERLRPDGQSMMGKYGQRAAESLPQQTGLETKRTVTDLTGRRLWTPGQNIELHAEYPTPTQTELRTKWQEYIGNRGKVIDAPNVYGVMRLPDTPPLGYASIDVCEVLRETHRGLRLVEEPIPGKLTSIHDYAEGLSFLNIPDITSVLQVLMNNGLIQPVDQIDEIARIMRGWREAGIYTFANTSTLPGCELATIDFFSKHLPGGLDGLMFPRNHDGTLPMTKGVVAKNIISAIPPESGEIVAIHIDDVPNHNAAVRREVGGMPNSTVQTFLPEYPTHHPDDKGSVKVKTPLEAFQKADVFVRQALNL